LIRVNIRGVDSGHLEFLAVATENLIRVTGQSDCDTQTPDGRVSDKAPARRAIQTEITRET